MFHQCFRQKLFQNVHIYIFYSVTLVVALNLTTVLLNFIVDYVKIKSISNKSMVSKTCQVEALVPAEPKCELN